MQAQQGPHEPIKQAKAINYKYTQIYYYSYAKWSPLCVRQRKHWSGGQVREQQQAKRGLCPSHCSSAPNKGASSCFPLCPTTTGHCLQPSILSAASHTHTQSGHRPKSVMTVTTGATTGHATCGTVLSVLTKYKMRSKTCRHVDAARKNTRTSCG